MNRRGFIRALMAAPVATALPWSKIAAAIEPVMPAISAEINLSLADIVTKTIQANRGALIANIQANNELLRILSENRQRNGVQMRNGSETKAQAPG